MLKKNVCNEEEFSLNLKDKSVSGKIIPYQYKIKWIYSNNCNSSTKNITNIQAKNYFIYKQTKLVCIKKTLVGKYLTQISLPSKIVIYMSA